MSDAKNPATPSPVLVHLDDALGAVLPNSERPKLLAFDAAMAKTTAHHDARRCFRCAEWAIDLEGVDEASHVFHLVHKLRGVLHEAKETLWAFDMGKITHHPGLDVKIEWVDDAVAVAAEVAQRSTWTAVPWEKFMSELIAMEPETGEVKA
jgi:hypothetical protein